MEQPKMTMIEFALVCGEFTIKSFEAFKAQNRESEYQETAKKIHELINRVNNSMKDSDNGKTPMPESFLQEFYDIQENVRQDIIKNMVKK